MAEDQKRFVYVHTHGIDTPDRCASPFYLATTAALMDHEAIMVFSIKGTSLLRKGVAESLFVKEGGAPLRNFIDQALEAGVKFLVCAPSLDLNDMTTEDLIEEAREVIGGAALNELAEEADVLMTF